MKSSLMIFRVLRYLLQCLNVPVTNERLRNLIEEQLYQGSIQTITEALRDLNVDAKVYQFEEEDIRLVECPVIVHLEDSGKRFVVLNKIQREQFTYYDPVSNKKITEEKSNFFEKWTGAVLIPFTDEQSGDPDYSEHVREERRKRTVNAGIGAGITMGLMFLLIQMNCSHPNNFAIWSILFAVKITGLLIVSQIIKIELGESNNLITKICKTTDCGKVLNSKASKLFPWLTMGDIGVVYFGSGILLLSAAPFVSDLSSIIQLLYFLNIFTLPYTFFSVGYQRFVL